MARAARSADDSQPNAPTDFARSVAKHATEDGATETAWPGLTLVRISRRTPPNPVVYWPSLCVVASGRKRARLGGRSFVYDANRMLICSLTLPIESQVLDATPTNPFLAAVLAVDQVLVGQMVLEMDEFVRWAEPSDSEPALKSVPTSEAFRRGMARLVSLLDKPLERRVLGAGVVREIYYEILRGPDGHLLRDCVLRDGSAHRVARVVRYIRENYREPLDIPSIAKRAGLSPSALHHHFKQATTLSPVQFVKKLRLHHARAFLMSGRSAGEAAFEVGYTSPSQFSREFRRLFGVPPSQLRGMAEAAPSQSA